MDGDTSPSAWPNYRSVDFPIREYRPRAPRCSGRHVTFHVAREMTELRIRNYSLSMEISRIENVRIF